MTDIVAFCHQHKGKPVKLQLTDGSIMDGVIHDVLPDGIMFEPFSGPSYVNGKTNGTVITAIGNSDTKLTVKQTQFFFGGFGLFPFFIPFFGIVGFWW